jgi:hypothetical protein
VTEPSPEADRLWGAAQDVLRDHQFRLDRVDRRAGVVSTLPETSQQLFEFWRHDVATTADLWEATLNPIRRWIQVTFARDGDGPWTQVSVVVHKERLSAPDRQFNNSGAAFLLFGYTLPSTTGMTQVTPAHDRWIACGHDPAMEDYLLTRILERACTSGGP